MTDKARRKASITITPMSTAKQVREELCRATGQQVWSDNQYWSYYLVMERANGKKPCLSPMYVSRAPKANMFFFISEQKGRREVFDYIYDEIPDKDWQNPSNSYLVEQRYITLAYERWAGTEDAWVLDGDWMVSRPDILSWMRTIYWKHNKPRRLRMREGPLSNPLPRCREGLLLTPFM